MGALTTACINRDFAYISGWVSGRFSVDVSEAEVATWFDGAGELGTVRGRANWTDGTWFMWLRNRLDGHKVFRGTATSDADYEFVTAILHVGFIFIVETPEMLMRLNPSTEKKRRSEIARSKLFQLNRTPQPIDKTALLVGGKEP